MAAVNGQPPSQTAGADELGLSTTIFKRLHPRTYLERFLSASLREDGRRFSHWRHVSLVAGAISSADGSCLCRLGNTTVCAGLKAEIARPEPGRERSGWFVPNLEYGPLSSSRGRPGPPSEEAQIICDRITDILGSTSRPVLDVRDLCIEPEVAAWCLYLDITVVSNDGNILDAAILASIGALQNCTLPATEIDAATGHVLCSPDASLRKPLRLLSLPLSFSFGVYEGAHLLSDPSSFEAAFTAGNSVAMALSTWTEEGLTWQAQQQDAAEKASSDSNNAVQVHYLHQVGRCKAVLPADEAQSDAAVVLNGASLLSNCFSKASSRYAELQIKLKEAQEAPRKG